MKKKILAIVSIFTLIAAAGGGALIYSIKDISQNLNDVILLHQVEIQREHLLLNVHQVQEDLYSQSTKHPESVEVMIERVNSMGTAIAACSHCHHTESVAEQLSDLQQQIGQFDDQLTQTLAINRNDRRFMLERGKATVIGDSIISKINTMIILTNQMLAERTEHSQEDMRRSELIVFALVICGPLMVAAFGFATLYSFANPIQILLSATKRLQSGDLDFRVAGLKGEFADLAVAFNDMAGALRDRLREITESEHRYRLLFESAGDAIFILDAEGDSAGKIVSANRFAAEMHGFTVKELTSMNIRDIDSPEAAVQAHERIERLLNGEWLTAEINHVKKDGTVFPVEISAGMFEFDDHKYVMAIDRDMTERKRAEDMLKRAEHFKTTGELAAGLAHEIKNPLAGIKITMETLAAESYLMQEDRSVLFKVIGEIKRIDGLIKGLLNFARPPRPHFMETDVNSVLDAAAQLVMQNGTRSEGASGTIDLVREFDPDLPEIIADPMQLRQVFMNLLMNAVDAMPGHGSLVLRTSFNEAVCAVNVSISDSGKGIDAAVLDRIFQPFFTTKAGGTGLGLAISKRLIEEQGGGIAIESRRGRGTTFTMTLPCNRGKETPGDQG
ncbi:MAG: ATP-binding protein [Nitrospirota bacterium]